MWEPARLWAWGPCAPGDLVRLCQALSFDFLQVNSYAPTVGKEAQGEYTRIVDLMCQKLRAVQYNGSYFDRGARAGLRLCTPEGWFCCQVRRGPWIWGHPGDAEPASCGFFSGSPLGLGLTGGSAQPLDLQSLAFEPLPPHQMVGVRCPSAPSGWFGRPSDGFPGVLLMWSGVHSCTRSGVFPWEEGTGQ